VLLATRLLVAVYLVPSFLVGVAVRQITVYGKKYHVRLRTYIDHYI
jgi:hypothetical protein